MLLLSGLETVVPTWHVDEDNPTIFTRIYYMHKGYVEYKDSQGVRILKNKHLYCFPTDRAYHMRHDKKDPLNCFFLHLNVTPYSINELCELDCTTHPFLVNLLNTMEGIVKDPNAKKMLEPLSQALTIYLRLQGVIKDFPKPITSALEYIIEHLEENPTITEISAHCGYNSQYFIRMFTRYIGSPPHQYILSYKMQIAMGFLREGLSVTETTERLGFIELKSFSRCFKRQFGFSPTAFKKHFILMP